MPSKSAWRPWLLALCTLATILTAAQVVWQLEGGSFGLSGTPTQRHGVDRLLVSSGSTAAQSGIETGDVLDVLALTPAARFRLWSGARVGEPVALAVVHRGVARTITVAVRKPDPFTWPWWLYFAGAIWITLFCALLAWRRPESAEARMLVFFLLFVFVISQGLGAMTTPWPSLDFAGLVAKGPVFAGGYAFLAAYAACFTWGSPRIRCFTIVLAGVLALIAEVFWSWQLFGIWSGRSDPFLPNLLIRGDLLPRVAFGAAIATAAAALLAALAASRGAERTRLLWAVAGVIPMLIWSEILVVLGGSIPLALFTIISSCFWFITPAVLSYSLLNKKLLDIGFVINRAAVFAGVSIVLLGIFVLVEWLLADWLRSASHTTNVLVSGGVALALGLSIRLVHGRVDRVVDSVFFRKRHEDEEAIRTFAREAPYVTDHQLLLQRAMQTLSRHTNASAVEIVMDYDQNDTAIVRLRARPQVLDLHGLDTQLNGDLAFPMTARGQLIGVVVLGARSSGETYAPDETAAIADLARSLGSALDTFGTKNGDVLERMVASMDALRDEIRSSITLNLPKVN